MDWCRRAAIPATIGTEALGAKLSGSGGGECMIALCPPENIQK